MLVEIGIEETGSRFVDRRNSRVDGIDNVHAGVRGILFDGHKGNQKGK